MKNQVPKAYTVANTILPTTNENSIHCQDIAVKHGHNIKQTMQLSYMPLWSTYTISQCRKIIKKQYFLEKFSNNFQKHTIIYSEQKCEHESLIKISDISLKNDFFKVISK